MSEALRCPACGEPMLAAPIAHRAFACTACGGVWAGYEAATQIEQAVDAELVDLADLAEGRASAGDMPEDGRKCPECGAALAREKKAKTWLDVCKFHGTWFDKGELQRVSSILAKKRNRDAKKLAAIEAEKTAANEKPAETSGSTDWVGGLEVAGAVLEVVVNIFAALG